MILEMIYRNRTKDMFGRNLPKPYNFIINTKRQNSINCQYIHRILDGDNCFQSIRRHCELSIRKQSEHLE